MRKPLSRKQNQPGTDKQHQHQPLWQIGKLSVIVALLSLGVGDPISEQTTASAQERGKRRSAEAEAGPRRSAEGEAGPRRSAEGERGARRPAEGNGRSTAEALKRFRPQTQREAALLQLIIQLQREVAALRREIQSGEPAIRAGARDGESRGSAGPRDGEAAALPAGWERTKAGSVFRTYDKNRDQVVSLDEWLAITNGNVSDARRKLQTERFREAGAGKNDTMTAAQFVAWWNARNGAPRGARDGENGRRPSAEGKAGPRRAAEGEGQRRSPEAEAGPRRSPEGKQGARRGSREG